MDNDVAFVFSQGGPLFGYDIDGYDPMALMPEKENLLRVYPFQSQMINSNLLSVNPAMNEEQSLYEHHQSAEMLHRTISYLKERGKKVFVITHSYGTMVAF